MHETPPECAFNPAHKFLWKESWHQGSARWNSHRRASCQDDPWTLNRNRSWSPFVMQTNHISSHTINHHHHYYGSYAQPTKCWWLDLTSFVSGPPCGREIATDLSLNMCCSKVRLFSVIGVSWFHLQLGCSSPSIPQSLFWGIAARAQTRIAII